MAFTGGPEALPRVSDLLAMCASPPGAVAPCLTGGPEALPRVSDM